VHENVTRDSPCQNSDFLRRLAFAVWHSPEDQKAYSAHTGKHFQSPKDFAHWLGGTTGDWNNLVLLVVWAWERVSTRQKTYHQTLSPISHTLYASTTSRPSHPSRVNTTTASALVQPSSTTDRNIVDWCTRYGLGEKDILILGNLGFVIGDDLESGLEAKEWEEAGARPLDKNRIVGACKKYKADCRGHE
jgi:hypothetical protein